MGYLSSPGAGVVFTTNALVMNCGRLGINTASPQASLDVNGSVMSSSLAGSGARCVHVNNSGQLQLAGSDCGTIAGNDNMGDHTMTTNLVTANHWMNGDFDNEGIWVDSAGNVSIGTNTAYGRLDVKGSVGSYIQVWRNFSDVMQASMSVTGVLYADGSKLRNLPDGLGTHIATQTLSMAGYQILNVSSVTVTGAAGMGAARLRLASNVEISSETSASLGGGVRISSNVYIVGFSSAAKYYGDGSGLTGVSGFDNLGNHTATQNLNINNFNLLNVGAIAANPASSITVMGVLELVGSGYTQIWRNSIGVAVASMTDAGVLYADGSRLRNVAGGVSLTSILAASGNAGNGYIVNLSSLAIGRATADVPLDVQQEAGGNIRIQKWRDNLGIEVASMRSDGGLYLNNVDISSRLAVGNQASAEPSVISMVAGVFGDGDITDLNVGVGGVSLVAPATHKNGVQMVIGGSFYGGIPLGAGVTANFPTLIGVKAATMANTAGQVTNTYGLYVQNEQTAGIISNNYGIDIKQPASINITNNYGLMVRDQYIGTSLSYNIYSEGPNAVNLFEGIVVSSGGVKVDTVKAQPACIVANRGLFWVVQGISTVKDRVEVCAKDASDVYAWRTLY